MQWPIGMGEDMGQRKQSLRPRLQLTGLLYAVGPTNQRLLAMWSHHVFAGLQRFLAKVHCNETVKFSCQLCQSRVMQILYILIAVSKVRVGTGTNRLNAKQSQCPLFLLVCSRSGDPIVFMVHCIDMDTVQLEWHRWFWCIVCPVIQVSNTLSNVPGRCGHTSEPSNRAVTSFQCVDRAGPQI